jgi:hypothetical protein
MPASSLLIAKKQRPAFAFSRFRFAPFVSFVVDLFVRCCSSICEICGLISCLSLLCALRAFAVNFYSFPPHFPVAFFTVSFTAVLVSDPPPFDTTTR